MKVRDIFKNPTDTNVAFYLKALADDVISILNRGQMTTEDNLPFKVRTYTVGSDVELIVGISEVPVLTGISIIGTGSKKITGFKTVRKTDSTMGFTCTFDGGGTTVVTLLLIGK